MNEVVSHNNNFTPQILEYVRSNEALADPATRRDYFEHLNGDDFIDWTQQVASLVRTGDSELRQPFDGETVGLMAHEVPDHNDKEGLLRETWDTAKQFLTDTKLSDEDALEYAALTVAGGILYTHPFADGNGRTSRFTSFIMAQGGEHTEALEAISQSLSYEWQVSPAADIARSYRGEYITEYASEQPQDIEWEFQFAGEAEDALGGEVTGSLYSNLIVRKFIDTADADTKKLIESCVTRDDKGTMLSLNGDKLIEVLVTDPEHGIRNAQHLIELKHHFQARYVRKYLAAMRSDVYDERHVLKDDDVNPPTPLEELPNNEHPSTIKMHENRKERYAIISGVLGARAMNGRLRARDEAVAQHRAFSHYHRRKKAA